MAFRTIDEVGTWAAQNGGADAVRRGLAAGIFSRQQHSINLANEWLRLDDARAQSARSDVEHELRLREITATEVSASATKEAANAAKQSAKWAIWSVIISVIALLIAAFK